MYCLSFLCLPGLTSHSVTPYPSLCFAEKSRHEKLTLPLLTRLAVSLDTMVERKFATSLSTYVMQPTVFVVLL
ncbi:hypothetical protein GGS24DRAFT_471417, partial [Hypoxylon argillaceum]